MNNISLENKLIQDIRQIVIESKNNAIQSVNSILTMMYWQVGNTINQDILKNNRADYGKSIVATLSRQLQAEFGRGFDEKNLHRIIKFATIFNKEKVASLMRELSWSHFVAILPIEDETKRDFYLHMCKNEKWSVRVFRERVNSMLYERTVLSKHPAELIKHELAELEKGIVKDTIVLNDPYLLDFLDIKDRFLEKDLEDAILHQLEEKKLIAIDLKIGDFKPEYKGQMELYLRWLDKHEKQADEQSPIGIILCTGKKEEQIELLELEKSGIHVAEYLTVLPSKELLQHKLQQAIKYAKNRHQENLDE